MSTSNEARNQRRRAARDRVRCAVCGSPVAAERARDPAYCCAAHRQQAYRERRGKRRELSAIVPRGTLAERGADLYETPPEAVRALLAAEALPAGLVWEPACGPGAIARVLRAAGREVWATDLADYASPDQDQAGIDFLLERAAPAGVGGIVTNPPYKLAGEFAAHAIRLVPRVYMLLRLAFLESVRRTALLESGHLARVLVFRERLPMMHRADHNGRRIKNGAVPFAWFVWDRAHRGDAVTRRISWRFDEGARPTGSRSAA